MKGLTTLAFFGALYFLLIIIFFEVAGEPRGVQQEGDINVGQQKTEGTSLDKNGQPSSSNAPTGTKANDDDDKSTFSSKSDNVAGDAQKGDKPAATSSDSRKVRDSPGGLNATNPVADLFSITDPNMRNALGVMYGAYRGNDQCSRKAFCLMGNYMKDMPGRDLLFLMMGQYIPPEYNLYYEIFKVAVIYGQNCDVYVCVPGSQTDAASSAQPQSGAYNPSASSSSPAASSAGPQEPGFNSIPR